MSVTVSMKMSPKQAGALYMKNIEQEKRIKVLEKALMELQTIFKDEHESVTALHVSGIDVLLENCKCSTNLEQCKNRSIRR